MAQADGAVVGDQGIPGHVRAEQGHGPQPAGVRKFGQGRGERQPGADPHGRVQSRADDGGEPGLRHDVEGAPHSPQRGHLHDDQVRRTGAGHLERVVLLAHALVRGDQHRDPGGAQPAADLGEAGDVRDRLLGVFQPDAGQPRQCRDGGRHVPAPVRVDPDRGVGERFADRGNPRRVVLKRLTRLGDFDLDGVDPPEAGQDFRHPARSDCGDRGIDGNHRTQWGREALPPGFDGCGEPAGGFDIAVLGEGAELAPALRSGEEQCFAFGDAPELHPHRQAHHPGNVEEFLQSGEPASSSPPLNR